MLDLDFSPEQEMLRQTTRDVLQRHCPLDVVRDMEDNPTGYPLSLWTQLGELDLIGLLLPVEHGGSGMTLVEGVALYQEFGRSLAPIPHFVSAVLSGGVLAAAGSDALQAQWLGGLASGESTFTPAWLEPENGYSPGGGRGPGRGRRIRTGSGSAGSSDTWPLPRRRTGWWCWPGPGTTLRPSTSSWSIRRPSG